MRALIAEENHVSRAALSGVLERLGFVVEEVRDELGAACLLYGPPSPDLALLAVDTVLVEFAAICKAVRVAQPAVYIVALVSEAHEHEVLTALEAGADDFMVRSGSLQAAEARLRVIRASLARRGSARGEPPSVLAKQPERAADDAEDESRAPERLLRAMQVHRALHEVLARLHLEGAREIPFLDGAYDPAWAGWLPVLIQRAGHPYWMNISLEIDDQPADALYKLLTRTAFQHEGEMKDLLRQLMHLMQEALRGSLPGEDAAQVLFPTRPLAMPGSDLPIGLMPAQASTWRHGFALDDGIRFSLAASVQPMRTIERALTDLRPFDVLAASLEAGEEQTLLREGVMLDDRYINKLYMFSKQAHLPSTIRVYRPPSDTVLFLDRR